MDLKIAVIGGGISLEASVSRSSAREVAKALRTKHTRVIELELDATLTSCLMELSPDVIFPVLHGPPGEDGTVQGYLEILGLPYVGSDVHGSAVGMDKNVSKSLFREMGLPVLKDLIFLPNADVDKSIEAIESKFGSSVVIKPSRQGSAIGITPLPNGGELRTPMIEAMRFGDEVLVEPFTAGKEITVGIVDLEGQEPLALPVIEIRTPANEWYDFENRYTPGKSEHIVPARLTDSLNQELQDIAIRGHKGLGLRDLSRADFIVDEAGEIFLLEINTLPGMTPTSLYPDGARAAGIDFETLVDKLVHSAHQRGA